MQLVLAHVCPPTKGCVLIWGDNCVICDARACCGPSESRWLSLGTPLGSAGGVIMSSKYVYISFVPRQLHLDLSHMLYVITPEWPLTTRAVNQWPVGRVKMKGWFCWSWLPPPRDGDGGDHISIRNVYRWPQCFKPLWSHWDMQDICLVAARSM